jgi:hypothetical protein
MPCVVCRALERQDPLADVGPLAALHVEREGALLLVEDVDVSPPVLDGHKQWRS